jgi:hypothetical protein
MEMWRSPAAVAASDMVEMTPLAPDRPRMG